MKTRLLFIEDEPFIAELYAQVMEAANYEVKIIGDGVEGLKAAQKEAFDIVLLDLMLPNMPGMDILRALRDPEQSPNFHAPVIILTNLDEDDLIKQEINKLAQVYLTKADISPRQLVEYLQKFNKSVPIQGAQQPAAS